jgi:hypothetical protein
MLTAPATHSPGRCGGAGRARVRDGVAHVGERAVPEADLRRPRVGHQLAHGWIELVDVGVVAQRGLGGDPENSSGWPASASRSIAVIAAMPLQRSGRVSHLGGEQEERSRTMFQLTWATHRFSRGTTSFFDHGHVEPGATC